RPGRGVRRHGTGPGRSVAAGHLRDHRVGTAAVVGHDLGGAAGRGDIDRRLVVVADLRRRVHRGRPGRRAADLAAGTVGAPVSERSGSDLLSIAEELYGLPLAEFTPARDAKAKELKGTPLAAQVKALKKPSVAAWVATLLVRHDTEQVDQVLAVGAALRDAQASMSGQELRA